MFNKRLKVSENDAYEEQTKSTITFRETFRSQIIA